MDAGRDPSEEGTPLRKRVTVAALATGALAMTVGVGSADAAKPRKNEIRILGHTTFKPGKFARDDQRFSPLRSAVKSGATVTVKNKARTKDPHTLTFVEKSFLPTSFEAPAADVAFAAHQPQGDAGPFFPLIDDGAPAADQNAPLAVNTLGTDQQAGDSMFVAPKDSKKDVTKVKFTVTADPGSTLYYFCAIHPWMQGKIKVK
jgi:plastocyanin